MAEPAGLTESTRQEITAAARAFLGAAFSSLADSRALPPPRLQPYLVVGRDYFGDEIQSEAFNALDHVLSEAFPERFSEPRKRGSDADFASLYVFSLLEAAIALCALQGEAFSPDSPGSDQAIASLIGRLAVPDSEVVCCRFVTHVTTATGEPLEVGDVTIIPQSADTDSRDYSDVARLIPAAGEVFRPQPPFVHDRPHSLIAARDIGRNPFDIEHSVSAKIDRFLLLLRLVHAATAQSHYEVRGETSWVSRMRPRLVEFLYAGMMGPMTRRTVRLSEQDANVLKQLDDLLDSVEVNREEMAATSWDVALRNFARSFVERGWPEQLIDLATALEALLSGTAMTDLTLRLRVRAAALLATDNDPGPTVFGDVGTLYSMRSRVVHGANIKSNHVTAFAQGMSTVPKTEMHGIAVAQAVDRARDLVRRSVLARLCLAAGDEPVWPLGKDEGVDAALADDATRVVWRSFWQQKLAELGAARAADKAAPAADWLSDEGRR